MDALALNLRAYRAAVDDLMIDLAPHANPAGLGKTKIVLENRLLDPDFSVLLAATPRGVNAAVASLLVELTAYQPNSRSSARDMAALIRIYLLSQIDAAWWGRVPAFDTDADVLGSPDLVDLGRLAVDVSYRRQPTTFPHRAARAIQRRLARDRTPHTAGLRFTQVRPEAAALISQLADAFARSTPAGTPPLWITSLTRSVRHQHHLRTLGYAAVLPSSHCTGYGMDIEMSWYRRFGVDHVLQRLLHERQDLGDVNVIDEGQAWHVCISPTAIGSLRHDFVTRIGG